MKIVLMIPLTLAKVMKWKFSSFMTTKIIFTVVFEGLFASVSIQYKTQMQAYEERYKHMSRK